MKPTNSEVTSNINDNNSFLYKELFYKSFSIMLLIDPDTGKILEANDAACNFYGYSLNEITQLKISDINILTEEEVKKEINKAKNAKRNYFNFKHKLANNKIKDVEVYSNLINYNGKGILFSVMHDVTEKFELRTKAQENEDKFNSVFNSYDHPTHMVNRKFDIVSVNKKLLKLKGLKKENIIGKKCYEVLRNKQSICDNCNIKNLFDNKPIDNVKQTLEIVDGKYRIYETSVYPIKNKNNEINHAIEVAIDITEKETLIDELKHNKNLLEIAQEMAHIGHWELSIKEDKLLWSDEVYRILEIKPQNKELTYNDFLNYVHNNDRDRINTEYKTSLKDKTDYKTEHRLVLDNGKIKYVIEQCKTIYDTNGNPIKSIGTIQDITNRKNNEILLKISEQRYRHLTNSIADCVFTINLKGEFTYLNKAFEKITKFKIEDFIGTHFLKQVCPEYKEIIANNFAKGLKGEESPLYEIEIFDKDNNRIPIELKVTSLVDKKGNVIGRTGAFRDVTERKLVEKEINKNKEHFKLLIEEAADIIVLLDKKGKVKYLNRIAEKLTGYKRQEVINTSFANYIPKEDIPKVYVLLEKIFKNNKTVTFESFIISKNGKKTPFISTGKTFEYNGEMVNMVIIKDIGYIKEAELALKESRELYQSIFETSGTAMLIMNNKFEIEMANNEFIHLVGAPSKDTLHIWKQYIPKDSLKLLQNNHLLRRKNPNNVPGKYPVKIQHFNGSFKEVIVNAAMLPKSKKSIISMVDVTEQNRALKQLEESERRFREMNELLPQSVYETDLKGNIIYANKFAIKLFGYTQEEFDKGLNFSQMLSPESRKKAKENFNTRILGKTTDVYEYSALKKDGTTFPIILSSAPIYKGSVVVGIRGVMTDLSTQKKAEENIIKFNAVSNQAVEGITIADNNARYTYVNPSFCKMTGYSEKELLNMNVYDIIVRKSKCDNFFECVKNMNVISEVELKRKDGSLFFVEVIGKVINIENTQFALGTIRDVTEQKKAKQKIIETEKLLIEAERIAKIGYWKIYHKEYKTEWSDEVFRIIGEKPQSFKPTFSNFIEAIHPEDIEKVFNLNKKRLVNDKKRTIEYRIITKKGKIKHVKEIWTTKYDDNGNPEITIGTVQDITTQKNNEITLKESEKRYKDLFYKSKDPTLLLYNNKIIDCNIETAKILETSSINNIIGKSPFDLSAKYQEDGSLSKEKAIEKIEESYKKGYNRFEWEHITFKGKTIYVEISLTPVTINNKKMIYVVWRDISKRKKAEKEINKLNIAVKQSPSIIVVTDINGSIEYINPAFTKITGYTQEETIGQNPRILASGKTTKKEYKKLWDTIKSGNVWQGELYNKKKDNSYYWEKVAIAPVKNNKGKIINFIAIKTDITKQKEIEEKEKQTRANLIKVNTKYRKQNIEITLQNKLLVESKKELLTIQKEFNSVIDASKAIFIEVDSNYKVLRWNKSAVKITGILSSKTIGRSIKELNLDSDINNLIIEIIENALNGKSVKEKEITFKSTNGEIQTILISSDTKLNRNNIISGVFIVAQDITTITNYNKFLEIEVEERTQELKEALLKEKELGELKSKFVSVVSHEFRTPLSAINFSANFINNYFDKLEKDKIKQKLKNIETQVKHMTMLLDDVLIMGRIQSNRVVFKPEIINAKEYFKPIIEEVYISKNKTHKIIYTENIQDAKICVDKVQARNIFINLLSNAIKFSPNSNEVFIRVDVFNKNTKITITDTGIGIKDTEEIFKPFVRGINADNIQGTGLGLSIVKEAVKKHKGKIKINTKINEGTSIEVILPNNQETKNKKQL